MFPIHLNIDLSHTEKCIKLKYNVDQVNLITTFVLRVSTYDWEKIFWRPLSLEWDATGKRTIDRWSKQTSARSQQD